MKHKSVLMILVALSGVALAEDKPKVNAREAVEAYVAAALAGKVDDAAALAVAGQSPASEERIEEFPRLVRVQTLKMVSVLASEKQGQAIAVSESFNLAKANPDGRITGALVFALVKSGDKWLVKDIDVRSEKAAEEKAKGFATDNPDAKEIPGKPAK